jgi:hypothetical protein
MCFKPMLENIKRSVLMQGAFLEIMVYGNIENNCQIFENRGANQANGSMWLLELPFCKNKKGTSNELMYRTQTILHKDLSIGFLVGLLKSSGTYAQWMTGCDIKTLFAMDSNTDCIQLTFVSQLLLGMYQTSKQIKLVRSIFKLSDNCVTVAYRLSDSE